MCGYILFFIDNGYADVGLDAGGIQLKNPLEASPSHLILAKIEEAISHANSGLHRQGLVYFQALFVEVKWFLVVFFGEVDLGQHERGCD